VDKFNLSAAEFSFGTFRVPNSSPGSSSGWKKAIDSLERKYGIFRVAKFAVASGIGFLIAEVILILGVLFFYGTTAVPSVSYSSPTILGLNALAFGIGVTVAFIINERVTVRGQVERRKDRGNWIKRWGKYQLASLLGNVVIVGVQLGTSRDNLSFPRHWKHNRSRCLLSSDVFYLDAFGVGSSSLRWEMVRKKHL